MPNKIEYPPSMSSLNKWRMEVKRRLFVERGWMCERDCGHRAEHLDEGIVTRGDMRGFSDEQKLIAFATCNLFLVCAECNMNYHDRAGAWKRACNRYGEMEVINWYKSLNLRAPRVFG